MMGRWHREQEEYFDVANREQPIGEYRADVLIGKYALEFQHSDAYAEHQIRNKNKVYEENGIIPIWILDVDDRLFIQENRFILQCFVIPYFRTCKNIYLSFNDFILQIRISGEIIVENEFTNAFELIGYLSEFEFYNNLKSGIQLENIIFDSSMEPIISMIPNRNDQEIIPKFYYIQMGAGSGKTYSICKECFENDNKDIIILSKMNSAKGEVAEKIIEVMNDINTQIHDENDKWKLINLNRDENYDLIYEEFYEIDHPNEPMIDRDDRYQRLILKRRDIEKKIVIATVDSFMVSCLRDNGRVINEITTDMFSYIAASNVQINTNIVYKDIQRTNACTHIPYHVDF